MGGMTIKALANVGIGVRLKVGVGLYLRRNADATATLWARIKRDGKSVDAKAGTADWPITSARALAELLDSATQIRIQERRKPAAKPTAVVGELSPSSTVFEAATALAAAAVADGKWTDRNAKTNAYRLNKWVHGSKFGGTRLADVTPQTLATFLSTMSAVPDQQRKVRGLLSLSFARAVGAGAMTANPTQSATEILNATRKKRAKRHFPTLEDKTALANVYAAIDELNGSVITRQALKLQALTCLRSGEVTTLKWDYINMDKAVIEIPREMMKSKDETRGNHVVPLSRQALSLLKTIKPKDGNPYLFPARLANAAVEHLDENTLSVTMRRDMKLAGKFVPHSWRAAFRTLGIREVVTKANTPRFAANWLESVLDHVSGEKLGSAYDRGQHIPGAALALQWWADVLTGTEK
jgi:integrase